MSDTEQPEEQHANEPSSDWKRDSIWHYRNFILAGIGILVTVALGFWLDYLNKPVKALTCDVITAGPLVSVEDNVSNRIQIVFDHVPVPNVKFAVVKIANPGNIPIDKSDFERPLSLRFGDGTAKSNILTAQLLNTHPNNLGATYKISGDTVTLDPLLLNPSDTITVKVIYTGQSENMNLDARIVGVSEVTGTDPSREQKAVFAKSFEFGLAMALGTTLIGWILAARNRIDWERVSTDPVYFRKVYRGNLALKTDEEMVLFMQFLRDELKKGNVIKK